MGNTYPGVARGISRWLCLAHAIACACGAPAPTRTRAGIDAGIRPIPQAGSAAIGGSLAGWPGTDGPIANPSGLAGMVSLPIAGTHVGAAGQAPSCGRVSQMAEVKPGPVDIVWIIDGSGSMLDELNAVQQNISRFANEIGNVGIDHHVAMLTQTDTAAGTPLAADPQHYLFVPALVGSHNALQVLLDMYPRYAPFLRPAASLHFIVVSDDESQLPAQTFRTEMEKLAGKPFIFHAIASESVNGQPCAGACGLPILCGAFAPGLQYYALAEMTGGEKISICVSDWSMVFGALQSAVIESAPLPCEYPLPAPPLGETLDPNKVNFEFATPAATKTIFPRASGMQACSDQVAWFYDNPATPAQIELCPAACQELRNGGSVSIELGCEVVPVVLN